MAYQYDVTDFKRYLNDKNAKYRVDGLIFWQNRIPLPIDLFNRFFDEADAILEEYIRQVTVCAVVLKSAEEFSSTFGITVGELPGKEILKHRTSVREWLRNRLKDMPECGLLALDIADILNVEGFELRADELTDSVAHQGKKYARLFLPDEIRDIVDSRAGCGNGIGGDNTDMFGNIIADRYDIYRSGFSDALAIIFNNLLEFRILCSGHGSSLKRLNLSVEKAEDIDIRLGRTSDGALWEPGYDDEHYVIMSEEHPLLRGRDVVVSGLLAELLYYLAEFENNQYSDSQKKLIENMRQEVSRGLWIRHD